MDFYLEEHNVLNVLLCRIYIALFKDMLPVIFT